MSSVLSGFFTVTPHAGALVTVAPPSTSHPRACRRQTRPPSSTWCGLQGHIMAVWLSRMRSRKYLDWDLRGFPHKLWPLFLRGKAEKGCRRRKGKEKSPLGILFTSLKEKKLQSRSSSCYRNIRSVWSSKFINLYFYLMTDGGRSNSKRWLHQWARTLDPNSLRLAYAFDLHLLTLHNVIYFGQCNANQMDS